MRILLFMTIILLAKICCGQDSTSAVYITSLVEKAEARIASDIVERKDTSIYDEGDTLQTRAALTVHTEFYTDPQTMLLDKIVEKSLYNKTSTLLTIYFFQNQPVRFTNQQWEGSTLRVDFDVYYRSDNLVYTVKRSQLKGKPDGGLFLKWCYELRKEYFGIVNQYNPMYARRKSRSR